MLNDSSFGVIVDTLKSLSAKIKAKPDVLFGTVSGVSGGTAQVVLDGDASATPCKAECACTAGDRVTVIRRGVSCVAVSKAGGDAPAGITEETGISGIITAGTYITVSGAKYATWGKVAMLTVEFSRSAAISDGQNFPVGTVASGKRPNAAAGGSSGYFTGWLTDSGTLTVRNVTGAQIAANSTVYITFVYLLP